MRLNRLAESLSVESIRKLLKLKKNLGKARAMEKRRKVLLRETVQLEKAIAKLREPGKAQRKKRRRFSAASRKRMAVAQRRRWAKIHRQKKTPTRNRKVEATALAGTTL